MNRLPPAVLALLILNVVLFAAGLFVSGGKSWLIEHGAFWFSENPRFGLWQAVSYMFLHGGPGHILFNMFGLVSFGGLLERLWGTRRFLVFYFLCGLGAAFVHNAVNVLQFSAIHEKLVSQGMTPEAIQTLLSAGRGAIPQTPEIRMALFELYRIYAVPMIGASGAIYGILVAYGLLFPNAKLLILFLPVPVAAKFVIPVLLALDLLSGLTGFSLFGGGIAHFAHLGGAFIGLILMLLWRRKSQPEHPTFTAG